MEYLASFFFCGSVLKQSIMAGSVVKLLTLWWLIAEHHGSRECGKTTHLMMTEGKKGALSILTVSLGLTV